MKRMKKISKIFLVLAMIFSQLSSVVTVLADEIMTKDLNLNLNYEKDLELGYVKKYELSYISLAGSYDEDKDYVVEVNTSFTYLDGETESKEMTPVTKTDVNPTTQQVQNPNIVSKSNDFVPSKTKQGTSIDNSGDKSYFSNKVEAPETEPVTKSDVQPQNNVPQTQAEPEIGTEPVTKSDVEGETISQDNKLTNSFKDMMNRMDNLNKDNEEEEK